MTAASIIKQLRQAGHKVTPQRTAIIKTVLESEEHLTPSALLERVRRNNPEIGEVTVYRTLNILTGLGLVCEVHTGENVHGYISRPSCHHDHLICSQCGRVINFTDCNLPELEQRLASEKNFKIKDHRLDFYGICKECVKSDED